MTYYEELTNVNRVAYSKKPKSNKHQVMKSGYISVYDKEGNFLFTRKVIGFSSKEENKYSPTLRQYRNKEQQALDNIFAKLLSNGDIKGYDYQYQFGKTEKTEYVLFKKRR